MTVKVLNNFKYMEFTDKGIDYVVHATFVGADSPDLDLLKLSRVVLDDDGVRVPEHLSRTGSNITDAVVERSGGVLVYANSEDGFVARVNKYLASVEGEVIDGDTFPEGVAFHLQWAHLLEKGFVYANGRLLLAL